MPCLVLPPEIVARQKAQEERMLMQFNGKPGMVLWAEGTVKDTSGRPLVKADVYLRTAHDGGMRMNEDILATTTDAQGHYSFSGEVHPMTESPVLVAKVEGRPPAVVNAEARTVQNDRPAKVDLTIADAGGSASVTVLRDGKPLPDATVELEATGSAAILSGFGWARRFPTSGESGVRRDRRAPRGHRPQRRGPVWRAHPRSLQRPRRLTLRISRPPAPGEPSRTTASTPAKCTAWRSWPDARRRRSCQSQLPKPPTPADHTVRFQVIRPDGRPVTDEDVSFQFGQRGSTHWNTQHEGRRSGDRRSCVHFGRSL